jgi:putative ABC transport system permease protein
VCSPRQNVVASLAGRRGVTRSRKRWLLLGIAMAAAGTVIVVAGTLRVSSKVMLAGLVVGELGMVLCTPAIVGLIARLGRVLPLPLRIALRDAGRNRAAAAPAISAVLAAVAGSVAIGLYIDSSRALTEAEYRPTVPIGTTIVFLRPPGASGVDAQIGPIQAALRATVPVTEVRTLSQVGCANAGDPTDPSLFRFCTLEVQMVADQVCPFVGLLRTGTATLTPDQVAAARRDRRCNAGGRGVDDVLRGGFVDDGSALAMFTGASAADIAAATAVLRDGGVVVSDGRFVADRRASVMVIDSSMTRGGSPEQDAVRLSLPAYVITTAVNTFAIYSPAAVAKAKLAIYPATVMASTGRMPTQAEQDRLQQQLSALDSVATVERGPTYDTDPRPWIIAAAAALITLGAAAVATGLAAADGRADLSILAAVGASPRLRRGLSLSQSAVIAGLGSLLGAGAGLGAAVAVLVALNQRYEQVWPGPVPMPITVPWASLGIALLAVPALAMLGAGLFTRSRLPIERRE